MVPRISRAATAGAYDETDLVIRLASMPLDVTILQVPARFGAPARQLAWIREQLRAGVGELLFLPEACLTGYLGPRGETDLSGLAEPLDGAQRQWLASLCTDFDVSVIGPLVEAEGDACFNTSVVLGPDGGLLASYRKRHPWYPETWATPGSRPLPRFTLGGLRCTLAICFDVHFLAEDSADVLAESDVLFFQSAWVDSEGDSLPGHLTTLARRFGITIVNSNWGPGQPLVAGQGRSLVVRNDGTLATRAGLDDARLDVRLD